jgi:hypothetical protein
MTTYREGDLQFVRVRFSQLQWIRTLFVERIWNENTTEQIERGAELVKRSRKWNRIVVLLTGTVSPSKPLDTPAVSPPKSRVTRLASFRQQRIAWNGVAHRIVVDRRRVRRPRMMPDDSKSTTARARMRDKLAAGSETSGARREDARHRYCSDESTDYLNRALTDPHVDVFTGTCAGVPVIEMLSGPTHSSLPSALVVMMRI